MNQYYSLVFLRKFAQELIKNSAPLYVHESLEKKEKSLEFLEKEITSKVKEDFVLSKKSIPVTKKNVQKEIKQLSKMDLTGMQKSILNNNQTLTPTSFTSPRNKETESKAPFMEVSQPKEERAYPTEGLYVGDLMKLIKDPNVASLECPGPDKFVSVRVQGQTKTTRTQIPKEDINAILESFSRESRIPRIGGIFKAIVNNLVLTAIDTDVAGPRFIITKIHPQKSQYL